MAKRAADVAPYHPVRESLVADVMAGGRTLAVEVQPTRESLRPVQQMSEASPKAQWEGIPRLAIAQPTARTEDARQQEAVDARKRLSREKRFLLSAEEEDRIEDLVRSLARELQTPLKLSHLVRAVISLITRSQGELIAASRTMHQVSRPSNGDNPGLLRFENEVARLMDSAFRMAKPL